MQRIQAFIRSFYDKPHFVKRFILCLIAVCIMGACVSWFALLGLGTDPCSCMNFGISSRLHWSFGNWEAFFNTVLLILILCVDSTGIGFGTILNMFVVGYVCDFTTWLRELLWPGLMIESLLLRVLLMLVILAIFVVAVAVYMSVDLGTAPYDAIPILLAKRQKKLSFRTVRILYDCAVTLLGYCLGATVGVVTVLMSLTIGPMASWVRVRIEPYL